MLRSRRSILGVSGAVLGLSMLGCHADPASVGSSFGDGSTGDGTTSGDPMGGTSVGNESTGGAESGSATSGAGTTGSVGTFDVGSGESDGNADPCSADELGNNYIGCEYYAVTMLQYMWGSWATNNDFAVSIANASDESAEVTITQGDTTLETLTVAPGEIEVVTLPWVLELTGQGHAPPTSIVEHGAYRVRSDRPVTVHQYAPITEAGSNDASLLLPANAWGEEYVVVSWPAREDLSGAQDNNHGAYAVIAREDDTMVTVIGSATAMATAGAGVDENANGSVMLDAGDVLQVVTWDGGQPVGGDLTGSRVIADKPVSVISGHQATRVPQEFSSWEHLEEAVLPVQSAGKSYVVAPPGQYPDNSLDGANVVRIIATEDGTELEFDPPQAGVSTTISNAGDFVEIPMASERYVVNSNKRILVAQYMVGAEAGYGDSDPSMVLAVPTEQWRQEYLFHAPASWTANFIDVITTDAATVTIDGIEIADWQPVGTSGYKHAHVELSNDGNGTHQLSAAPNTASLSVYGVRLQGSYWYPGGLDLNIVPAG